jgi:hypothetical protein
MTTMKQALQAKEKTYQMVKGFPWVNGVGVTWDESGEPCVRVNVESDNGSDWSKIPSRVDGVSVRIQPIGRIELEGE